ncbi:Amidase 1 [Cymbomonas tetramitiformis]|uniref:Amidase 1 n=1 Tax=Cymbomonas tetramitiformis TaxID=36881 RepID=A0AAE0G4Z5_9CHLO|nr:Amidase 1 [Cymbomonas tetramitiformis]
MNLDYFKLNAYVSLATSSSCSTKIFRLNTNGTHVCAPQRAMKKSLRAVSGASQSHDEKVSATKRNSKGGAYVDHCDFVIPGVPDGALSGLRFSVKDIFDVKGVATGFGNPEWLTTHAELAEEHAPSVEALLCAGATADGKTHMDELAYSLNGENVHYGTPINPAAPDRVPVLLLAGGTLCEGAGGTLCEGAGGTLCEGAGCTLCEGA